MMTKEEKERAKKINAIKYSHNKITVESALENDEWELVSDNYQDDKYTYAVFKKKDKRIEDTLWLHINAAGWTRVYKPKIEYENGWKIINLKENVYLKTLRTWKELNDLERVLFPGMKYYRYDSPKSDDKPLTDEEFLSRVKEIKTVHVDGYICSF